jgi:hypothetical protein
MAWPPPLLRTDIVNTTVQLDEHPDAHNDTNTAVNSLTERMPVLLAAHIRTTPSSPIGVGIGVGETVLQTSVVALRAGHHYRASMFLNYASPTTAGSVVSSRIIRSDTGATLQQVVTTPQHFPGMPVPASAFAEWVQSANASTTVYVLAWQESIGATPGDMVSSTSPDTPGILEILDLGRIAV